MVRHGELRERSSRVTVPVTIAVLTVSCLRSLAENPNYRILAHQRSRFTHYYFYLRDETLGPMAVRKVLHLPAQRAGLQQPRRFPSQEGIGPSRCRARALPNHHRSLRWLPGAVAQCPRRLPAAPAPRPPDHHRRGPLSRDQNPRPARHPPARGPLARRQSGRRLDRQADPPRRPHYLPPLRESLRPDPTPLRPAQAQSPRAAAA